MYWSFLVYYSKLFFFGHYKSCCYLYLHFDEENVCLLNYWTKQYISLPLLDQLFLIYNNDFFIEILVSSKPLKAYWDVFQWFIALLACVHEITEHPNDVRTDVLWVKCVNEPMIYEPLKLAANIAIIKPKALASVIRLQCSEILAFILWVWVTALTPWLIHSLTHKYSRL